MRKPPPRERWELTAFNVLLFIVFIQWGASLVLIFLLWNLEYLALVSGIVWTIVIIASERISRNMRKRLGWSIMEEIKKARKRSD